MKEGLPAVLSGLPSAGFGALLTLLVVHQELNIYSFVGIIMLVGLVKKNGRRRVIGESSLTAPATPYTPLRQS